jgi:4-carboxymuconolactone decarboxylase
LTRAVDELIVDGTINEPTWATLAAHLDKQQLLDVVFTVGTYDLLARLFNALQMGVDDDIPALMKRYDRCSDCHPASTSGLRTLPSSVMTPGV